MTVGTGTEAFDAAVFEALPWHATEQVSVAQIAERLVCRGIPATDSAVRRSLKRLMKEGYSVYCNKRSGTPFGWFRSKILSRRGEYHRSSVWDVCSNAGFSRGDIAIFVQVCHPEWLKEAAEIGVGEDDVTDWIFQRASKRCYATWVDADGGVAVDLLGFRGFYWLRNAVGETVGVYASPDDAVLQLQVHASRRDSSALLSMKPYRNFEYLSDEDREWLEDHAILRIMPVIVGELVHRVACNKYDRTE